MNEIFYILLIILIFIGCCLASIITNIKSRARVKDIYDKAIKTIEEEKGKNK